MKKQGMLTKCQKGFTLIELMVVMVVLAIITAIAVPIYNGIQNDAMAQEAQENMSIWGTAAVGRAQKAIALSRRDAYVSPPVPDNTAHFTYVLNNVNNISTNGITATLIGVPADDTQQTLTIVVDGDGPDDDGAGPTKVWGGNLY